MKTWLFTFVLLLITSSGFAQQAQTRCQSNPQYRQFDFWIGEWEVKNNQDQVVGQSRIELILGECVIFENWTGGTGTYTGKSFNYYSVIDGKWHQKWIDNQGIPIEFVGTYDADAKTMNYTGEGVGQGGVKLMYKLTFYHLADDHVRQHWEASTDEGKTWATSFDGHYWKKK